MQLPSCPQLHIVEQQHGTLNSTGGTLLWCAQLHTGVSLVCSNSNSSTSSTLHNNCALQHLCCALCSAVRGCSGVLNCDGALLHWWWWCAQLILFTCGDVQMPTLMDRRSNPHCYELVALCKKTSQELQMLSSVTLYSQICPHLKESNRPVLSGPSCLKDSHVHKTSRVAVILLILTIQLSKFCRNCPKRQNSCQLYLFTVLMGAMPADPGINPTHCTHCTFGLNKAHCGAFRWENTQMQTHKYKNTETQIHITNLD